MVQVQAVALEEVLRAGQYNPNSVSPTLVEALYAVTTLVLIAAGLTMVGRGVRAYLQTDRVAMLHLSIGFSLVVAGAAATMISAFVTGFENVRTLLLIQSSLTTLGFLFFIYSLSAYQ